MRERTIQLAVVVKYDSAATDLETILADLEEHVLKAGDPYAPESFVVVKAVTLL